MASLYRFKDITTVPSAKDIVDTVLSKTQRKTPTQVHPQFKITRIRSFYMRKVKFAQQTFRDKFSSILEEFPRLDEIHPFYGDLCNVLYDRDHYKLALGQINTTRGVLDSLGKDYVRLLKYADSHYKCKMLKRAALGRMVTAVKKLLNPLQYLEEVRQHMSRLPSINPTTRTLILAGYPNVGKSSFINAVSDANVDVQPYAFTTKSLFVGHFDYQYSRWQIVDTPGVLDHPLENRNTIEMTAITALAHLEAAVLYLVDVSALCGFTVRQQVELFHSIKPLFRNKPIVVALNKTDACPLDQLTEEEKGLIEGMKSSSGDNDDISMDVTVIPLSCLMKVAVDDVKNAACEKLLAVRLSNKMSSKKIEDIENRLTIVTPSTEGSELQTRPPCIPSGVSFDTEQKAKNKTKRTERDEQEDAGGAGVYVADWRKHHILKDPVWRYDMLPEIMDGRNIADYIDPQITQRLERLQREEASLLSSRPDLQDIEEKWKQTERLLWKLHEKIRLKQSTHHLNLPRNSRALHRKPVAERLLVSDVIRQLDELGYDTETLKENVATMPLGRHINCINSSLKKALDESDDESNELVAMDGSTIITKEPSNEDTLMTSNSLVTTRRMYKGVKSAMEADGGQPDEHRLALEKRLCNITHGHLVTLPSGKKMLLRQHKSRIPSRLDRSSKTVEGRWQLEMLRKKSLNTKKMNGKKGEADRHVYDFKPKHLFCGKRGIGKTQRR